MFGEWALGCEQDKKIERGREICRDVL